MKKILFYSIIIPLTLFISGCAYVPHQTDLSVSVSLPSSNIGSGTSLYLKFIDDRESTVVGSRGAGLGAKITAEDIMTIFEDGIREGFKNKGYQLVTQDESNSELKIKLRSFKYQIVAGFWTGREDINVVINVEGRNGQLDYEKTYRHVHEASKVFYADGQGLNKNLNFALNSTIKKLFNDNDLDQFLTK